MSLIVTSSSQAEFDQSSQTSWGIENPASFQNHLKSPLIIDANSEVALVSIKCNRDENKIAIKDEAFFVYWGVEKPSNGMEEDDRPIIMDDPNTPLLIRLGTGVEVLYTTSSFATFLQERLRDVVLKAYREVSDVVVTEVLDGTTQDFKGFKIQFDQVGNGSGLSDKPSASEFGAYIDATTQKSYGDDSLYTEDDEMTDNFTVTTSITNINITGNNATSVGTCADAIGKAHPLSLTNGKCVIYFNGSSAAAGQDGYTLGLVRSQGRTIGSTKIDFGHPGGLSQEKPEYDDDVNLPPSYVEGAGTPAAPFFWDVAFNWVNGQDGQVVQYVNDAENDEADKGVMKTITLANTPSNASLEAEYWDRVEFHTEGENIKVYLGLKGKTTLTTLVDGSNTAFGSRVKPMGITCNQLYPKVAIQNVDEAPYGDVSLRTYNGHADLSYYDRNYWGYDAFPRNINERQVAVWEQASKRILQSSIYGDGTDSNGDLYVYKKELGSDAGINYRWSLLLGDFDSITGDGGEVLYFTDMDQYVEAGELPDSTVMRRFLGFNKSLLIETVDGEVTSGGATVAFSSDEVPEFSLSSSMFVRFKNQALNSYNANKGSISNIIYGCPRFDSRGARDGPLWYAPEERVYVKFNNVDKFVLNSIDIDIVDVNEKVVSDLVGNTVVILHVKKSTDRDF